MFGQVDAFVVLDGVESKATEIDDGNPIPLAFSPDSKHVAYVGPCKGEWECIVLDGVYSKRCCSMVYRPLFSPDSRHFAYECRQILEGKSVVVLDDKEIGTYDNAGGLVFSPDSSRYAYTVLSLPGGEDYVVLDGVAGPKYSSIVNLAFSPDGKHLCYIANTGTPSYGQRELAVIDGVEGNKYNSFVGNLVFDGPNSLNAIAIQDGKAIQVHIDIEPRDAGQP
jgi:hypothetical protein